MTFNSYIFIFVYLPVFILGIHLIQRFFSTRDNAVVIMRLWIIAMSAMFFAGYGALSIGALFVSIIWNIIWGYLIDKKDISLIPGVLGNVVFLCFFKYNGSIVMPVAVSFYTFQQIAFLVMLKKKEVERFGLSEYLSYILFFPKIMQGPLADYKKITGELNSVIKKSVSAKDILVGMVLFILGLAKKVLISDALGLGADYGYSNIQTLTAIDAIVVALSYSLQLYFDFSGYCDMAEGICRMCGMDLEINFSSPYKARNIAEFWDRWHITLTRFFTKYVYIPLGGSRQGTVRTYLNILIVFLLSGIWHGAGFTFIIWGLMHGLMMVITRVVSPERFKSRFFTFIYVTAAWVFFRAGSAADALTLLGKIVEPAAWSDFRISIKLAECFQLDELWYVLKVTPIPGYSWSGYVCMWFIMILACLLVFAGKSAKELAGGFEKRYELAAGNGKHRGLLIIYMVLLAGLFVWCTLSLGRVSTFLYVNF
jgi:alginate O-acetyltransferase complex protein AlgI